LVADAAASPASPAPMALNMLRVCHTSQTQNDSVCSLLSGWPFQGQVFKDRF